MGDLPGLSRRARIELERAEKIGICTISCLELATLVARGRVALDRDVRTWVAQALSQDRVEVLPLDADTAVAAGALGGDFPGDAADRIIYATAVAVDAVVITKDRRLRAADQTRTVW